MIGRIRHKRRRALLGRTKPHLYRRRGFWYVQHAIDVRQELVDAAWRYVFSHP